MGSGVSIKYIRVRIAQFLIAELVLAIGLHAVFSRIPGTLFWPLTAGLAIPALFSEPYFTGPRAAIANALAQIASYFSGDHSSQIALWRLLGFVSLGVFLSALIAMARQEKAGQFFHWVSTRIGRAMVLGSLMALILILQVATKNIGEATGLAVLLFIFYGVLFLDWARLNFLPKQLSQNEAFISAILAPNQLLVRSRDRLSVGSRLRVKGPSGTSQGIVAEDLASDSGSEYRIVLDNHWRAVTDEGRMPCTLIDMEDDRSSVRGFAIEGSNETMLRVNPLDRFKIGETLQIKDEEGTLLYQVAGLRLEEENWSGGSGIVARAKLMQVGSVNDEGIIVARPTLPTPYLAVDNAEDASGELSDDFMRIGLLKGTSIPVGIRKEWLSNHGHLAILGMSGMGKTTTASKLAQIAADEDKFVILDETSEYRTRLGFNPTPLSDLDWAVAGTDVCEPGGELPQQCEKVIKSAMAAAQREYSDGHEPRRRFILLEEAHGWLPEWNFTTRDQADYVNKSCRYILQARKFNLSFIMVSQRTAVISKSALSQCENYIILRTLDQTSLEYVEGVVGVNLKSLVPELSRYEAICVGPIFNSDAPIIVTLDPTLTEGS